MPYEYTKILEFNQYQKSDKASFINYVDLECITEKINKFKNIYENSFTKLFTISSFNSTKNKHDVYQGKDCMKRFCESYRKHTIKKINIKKKKNEVIKKRAQES